ncbi:MAG: rRNA maturation RNase YbeY [Patescibacteria group bacterium]
MIKFNFNNETEFKINSKFFKKYVDKLQMVLKTFVKKKMMDRKGELTLVLVDDETIHGINRDYRQKDKPTDVISFAYLELADFKKEKGDLQVGDIFISIDTAMRQSEEKGHSMDKELAILFVHGLLHVFGFDHNNDEEEEEMEGWAKKLLGKI